MCGGSCVMYVAFVGMVCTLTNSDRLGIFRLNPVALGVNPGISRLQQSVKIAVLCPNRENLASIGTSGEVYFCAGSNIQSICAAFDSHVLRDAQR